MTITQVYKTENGTIWNTETEAIIADALEQSKVYIEQYKFSAIIEAIADRITVVQYKVRDDGANFINESEEETKS